METAPVMENNAAPLSTPNDLVYLMQTPEGTLLMPAVGFEFEWDGARYRVNSVAGWDAAIRELTEAEIKEIEEKTVFFLGSTDYYFEFLATNIDEPMISMGKVGDNVILAPNSIYLDWLDFQQIVNNRWWRTRA